MRKLCSAAALVAVVLAGGAFTTSAHAATQTEHTVPADGPDWCGPLHDDNTIPPPRKPDDRDTAQGQHSSTNGAYCSGDAGSPRKPGPQGYYAPKTPKSGAGQQGDADKPGAAGQPRSGANPDAANPSGADRQAATGEPAGTGAKP